LACFEKDHRYRGYLTIGQHSYELSASSVPTTLDAILPALRAAAQKAPAPTFAAPKPGPVVFGPPQWERDVQILVILGLFIFFPLILLVVVVGGTRR